MDTSLIQLSPSILYAVPVIIGLTQVLKSYIADRYVPLLALGLSIVSAFLLTDVSWQLTIVQGVAVGLMSIGAFSGVRSTVQG